jgi:two-component system response regulator AtoC
MAGNGSNSSSFNQYNQGPMIIPPENTIFGQSAAMRLIRQKLDKVCGTNVPILLQGEGGAGKEVIARWIHSKSPWNSGQFVKVNCAAIPGSLLESELFGHEKGAFTGAHKRKLGRVELAQNGTLFLDEIVDLDHNLQAKLLQFLQDGRFSRIGDDQEQCVETRVICATNRDLEREIERGKFRADLFYRINVIRIHMPPLRDRRDDVPLLADYFLSHFNVLFSRRAPALSMQFMHALQSCDWPGNIRELENRIARYVILGVEDAPDLKPEVSQTKHIPIVVALDRSVPLKRIGQEAVRQTESNLILKALRENKWNRRKAAQVLKISYRALLYKIDRKSVV